MLNLKKWSLTIMEIEYKKFTPWIEEPIDWKGEKSWEEAASDLALRVVKLENAVEIQKLLINQLNVLSQKQ